MQILLDITPILSKPHPFYRLLGFEDSQEFREFSNATKQKESDLVLKKYLTNCFIACRKFLVSRRWTYDVLPTSTFILRPLPEILENNSPEASLALVCTFNSQTQSLQIVDAESRTGDPVQEIESEFHGDLIPFSAWTLDTTDSEAISFLNDLPETGYDLRLPLKDWNFYLDWRQKLAEKKANEVYEYNDLKVNKRRGFVDFYLKDPQVLELIKTRLSGETVRVYTEVAERSDENDTPSSAPKAVYEASFRMVKTPHYSASTRGRGNYQHRSKGKPKGEREQLIISLALPDEENPNRYSTEDIPEHGYLRAAMEGELAAIDIQRNGLRRLAEYQSLNPNIRRWLFNSKDALAINHEQDISWMADGLLNKEQEDCVQKSLYLEDLQLLWGPPGTGKTTVIAEITSQHCRIGRRILISSQANLAVDQALEKLPKLPHIRFARISSSKQKNKLGIDVRNGLLCWLESVSMHVGNLAKEETDSTWKGLQKAWGKQLNRTPITDISEPCSKHYLRKANVIGATCIETGKPDFIDSAQFPCRFDLSIIDEVSKATPPELLLPAILGKRTILVGDHRQLPPVFRESTFPEAIENGDIDELEFERFQNMITSSMFAQFFKESDASIWSGLRQQYRMHPQIMAAVNQFYMDAPLSPGGGHESLSRAKAHNFHIEAHNGIPWLQPGKHLVWIDSTHKPDGSKAQDERVGTSRLNDSEAQLCVHLLKNLIRKDQTIGVISLYRAQIQNIERLLREESDSTIRSFVEDRSVNTVDQFQGSERDIIIVSLTRTDDKLTGEFIKDFRRINVAISRAKKLLIIIGRKETFDSGMVEVPTEEGVGTEARSVYREIREIARKTGCYVSLKNVLNQNTSPSLNRRDTFAHVSNPIEIALSELN